MALASGASSDDSTKLHLNPLVSLAVEHGHAACNDHSFHGTTNPLIYLDSSLQTNDMRVTYARTHTVPSRLSYLSY